MKHAIALLPALVALCVGAARAQETTPPPAPAVRPFPDVPPNQWATRAVEQLHQLGLMQGYPAGPSDTAPTFRAPAKAKAPRAAGAHHAKRGERG